RKGHYKGAEKLRFDRHELDFLVVDSMAGHYRGFALKGKSEKNLNHRGHRALRYTEEEMETHLKRLLSFLCFYLFSV
ncbi:hypothetical protein, partial [Oleiphilus sp. HI0043]|uniref:hypothetical protein n=1 Tax=Oleiphilus sp. HI0043 TaxID=1822233 RepID=UPI000AB7D23F